MDCREFQRFVHIFLDGEFDERDRGEVEGHLRECHTCRQQAQFERWFREGLRSSYEHEQPPEHLRARIIKKLQHLPGPRARRAWPARLLPAAAAIAVGLWGWSLLDFAPFGTAPIPDGFIAARPLPPARRVPLVRAPQPKARVAVAPAPVAAPTVAAPTPGAAPTRAATRVAVAMKAPAAPPSRRLQPRRVDSPRRPPARVKRVAIGDRQLPLEIASSSPGKVRAFLRGRLGRSFPVPTFGGRARLVGGSADEEDSTAQLIYRYGRNHVTLQVKPYDDPTLPAKGIVVRQDGPHQVALWKHRGMTFSMTSLLDPVEMVGLVADELGVGRRRSRAVVSVPPGIRRLRRFFSGQPPRFKRNFSSAMPVSQNR